MACKATLNYLLVSIIMKLYCHLLVLISQMTVLNLVLGGTIFTEGGHFLGGTLYIMTPLLYMFTHPCDHVNTPTDQY